MKVIKKKKLKRKHLLLFSIILLILGLFVALVIYQNTKDSNDKLDVQQTNNQDQIEQTTQPAISNQTDPKNDQSTPTPMEDSKPGSQTPTANQWPVLLSNSQAESITVMVNKKHRLPSNYVPSLSTVNGGSLRPEVATAFNNLVQSASNDRVTINYISGYRSYFSQQQIYNNYVAKDGQVAADTYSARPGHSEHQTGLSVDIGDSGDCDLETCFANTSAGKWASANAHKYGFVIRYPSGKDSITGYQYEPWHLRYLGVNEAVAVYNSGKTLEEYYNMPGGGY